MRIYLQELRNSFAGAVLTLSLFTIWVLRVTRTKATWNAQLA